MIKSLFIIFSAGACTLSSKKTKERPQNVKTKFFEDINLFTLEGVRQIEKQPSYPYVQIEYVSNAKRNIIYHASKEDFYRREYKKENNYWISSFSSDGDTCIITTYEYVTQNRITEYYYCGNDSSKEAYLTDVYIIEDSTETVYYMKNETNIKPDVNAMRFVKNKSMLRKEITIKKHLIHS